MLSQYEELYGQSQELIRQAETIDRIVQWNETDRLCTTILYLGSAAVISRLPFLHNQLKNGAFSIDETDSKEVVTDEPSGELNRATNSLRNQIRSISVQIIRPFLSLLNSFRQNRHYNDFTEEKKEITISLTNREYRQAVRTIEQILSLCVKMIRQATLYSSNLWQAYDQLKLEEQREVGDRQMEMEENLIIAKEKLQVKEQELYLLLSKNELDVL